jgi:hypothetical protein
MSQEPDAGEPHVHSNEEWAELTARTVAHLAAQLTMMQIRLRALAGELNDRHQVDAAAVQARVAAIARADAETYLRENLGEGLTEVIDVESLAADLADFLAGDEGLGTGD